MLIDKIKEGDVIYSSCDGNELCYHLAIVYTNGNKKYVFHNAPTNQNKFGGTIISEPLEDYKKKREIYRVVSTGVKNHEILNIVRKNRHEIWDSILFNCEDFVSEIVQGERESDLRNAWAIIAIGTALMIMI